MRRVHRTGAVLLAVCVLLHLGAAESLAAEREAYTYTVTFHAGNQGVFPAEDHGEFLSVIGGGDGWQVKRSSDGSAVTVSGIPAGAQVSYDAAAQGAVILPEDSRYYVMGVRRSGYDNDAVDRTMFTASRDLDYVVAYGVQGEMTRYRVDYQDRYGNDLAESRFYTGKVGDRPVAAYLYIEGWRPQAYNLTRTLSKNEVDNVFTFVYTRVNTGSSGSSGTSGDSGSSSGDSTTGGGTSAGGAGTEDTSAGGTGGAAGAGGADADGTGGGSGGAAAEGAADASAADGVQTAPEEEEPRDLVDLDDEETPLANLPENPGAVSAAGAGMAYGLPVLASVSLILTVVIAAIAGLRYRIACKGREKKEEDER